MIWATTEIFLTISQNFRDSVLFQRNETNFLIPRKWMVGTRLYRGVDISPVLSLPSKAGLFKLKPAFEFDVIPRHGNLHRERLVRDAVS